MRCCLLAAAILALPGMMPALAQVYPVEVRPSGVSYRVAHTEHFDLIFQSGYESEAARTGMLLEESLARARDLTGTSRRMHMPVILNAYNDRSNGFVTAFPFKMEIEIPSLKGNRLSPRHPSWLHAVAPHELVHALQAESGSGLGVIGVIRWFSPDLGRALSLMVPAGIAEGMAVYMESEGPNRPGRLNHSLFEMEFRAAMASDRQWSLAQMLEPPAYSIPGDRYYNGGGHLYKYLYERDGGAGIRRAQRFHYRFPFLGYGFSLWVATGRSPWVLGRDFRLDATQREIERQLRLGEVTEPHVVSSGRGLVHRRPQWVSNSEVIAYVAGYHTVPGFYRVNIDTGKRVRRSAERITEDAMFTVSSSRETLVFSRYLENRTVASQQVAEVFQIGTASGSAKRITRSGHVFTPAPSKDGDVWGSVDSGTYSRIVRVGREIEFPTVILPPRTIIKSLSWSPAGDTLAALVNDKGLQGLYLIFRDREVWQSQPVLLPASGSILDFSWLPDGDGLLFTCDRTDVANIYVLTFSDGLVRQLTNARYGAFEGAVSPDGSRLAFVDYQHERWNLVTMRYNIEDLEPVDGAAFQRQRSRIPEPEVVSMDSPPPLDSAPYRAIRYMAPRELFPLFDYRKLDTQSQDVDLGIAVGAAVSATDPLQRWSYVAAGWYQADKFWGRATVRTSTIPLQPAVSAFRTPTTRIVNTSEGIRRVGREEEGVTMGLLLPMTLSNNIYGTDVAVGMVSQYSRARFFGKEGVPLTGWAQRATVAPAAFARVAAHANRRDLRLRRGLVFGATALQDVWSTSAARTGVMADARLFIPSLPGGSFSLYGGYLWQSEAAIYDLDFYMPRGLENTFVPRGGHVKYGVDLIQPLVFVDNGLVVLPVYLKSLYVFGFAESVRPTSSLLFKIDSVGGGVGIQMRFLYLFNLDLRFGATYLPALDEYKAIYR